MQKQLISFISFNDAHMGEKLVELIYKDLLDYKSLIKFLHQLLLLEIIT